MNEEILKIGEVKSKFDTDLRIFREETDLQIEILGKENNEKTKEIRHLKLEIDSLRETEFERYNGLQKAQEELHEAKIDLQNVEFELKKSRKQIEDYKKELNSKEYDFQYTSSKNSQIIQNLENKVASLRLENEELQKENSALNSARENLSRRRRNVS